MKSRLNLAVTLVLLIQTSTALCGQESLGEAARKLREQKRTAAIQSATEVSSAIAIKADDSPLTDLQIIAWLAARVPNHDLVFEVRERGLAFKPDETYSAQLAKAGANEELQSAVNSASVKPGTKPLTDAKTLEQYVLLSGEVRSGKYDDAVRRMQPLIAADFENPDLMLAGADVIRKKGDFSLAAGVLAKLAKNDPGMPFVHGRMSFIYYRQQDGENALAEAKTMLAMRPQSVEALKYLGLALGVSRRFNESIAVFTKAITMDPKWAVLYYDRAVMEGELSQYPAAVSDLQTATKLDPTDWNSFYNLGVYLADEGRYEESISYYIKAKKLAPEEPTVMQNLGATLCNTDRYAEAIPIFEELLKLDPSWNMARPCLAKSYEQTGHLEKAKAVKADWQKYKGPGDEW